MKPFSSKSYFWQILASIGLVTLIFQLITITTLAYFMFIPLGQRATHDLNSVIIHSAETWLVLPTKKRLEFKKKMKQQHQLLITDDLSPLPERDNLLPYLYFLEQSIQEHVGYFIPIKQSIDAEGETWFWIDYPIEDQTIRYGFTRHRIGVNPPIAFFILVAIGIYLTVWTAISLAKRLTTPIDRLHQAAQVISNGHWPNPVQIKGPEELEVLAREFNKMMAQVKELLSNRTTLLAGIAHDLRTPLTQIKLALAMLPSEEDCTLIQGIHDDIDTINHLISETLSISLELEEEKNIATNLQTELSRIINHIRTDDIPISVNFTETPLQIFRPLAFRRIITNLLVNAMRYGNKKPITINQFVTNDDQIIIDIIDLGNGIPENQIEAVFRPFYRLEKSRGSKTGGSGLGLAIVKQLADANNWEIQLLPNEYGGTTARLIITKVSNDSNQQSI